jgi:hypothetical protein
MTILMPRPLETWTPLAYLASIVATSVLALMGWLINQQVKDIEFRSLGGRFTHTDEASSMQQQRDWIDNRFENFTKARDRLVDILVHQAHKDLRQVHEDLKREDRRLQCGQDRMEGRECVFDGLDYTPGEPTDQEMIAREFDE